MPLQKQEATSFLTRSASPRSHNYSAGCSQPKEVAEVALNQVEKIRYHLDIPAPTIKSPETSSPGGACTLPSGMLSIPFFGTAQSHLAQQTTYPAETPHTKKDAIAISRESGPSLKAWGEGTAARAVFWSRG